MSKENMSKWRVVVDLCCHSLYGKLDSYRSYKSQDLHQRSLYGSLKKDNPPATK